MKYLMKSLLFCCVASLALVGGVALAESASLNRPSPLQSQPQADASALGELSKGAKVEVLSRAGGWFEVRTAEGKKGWVRMLDLRLEGGAAAVSTQGLDLGKLIAIGGSKKQTVTTGVRGMDKEDLANATPNADEFEKTKGNAVNRDAAQAFARKSGFSAQQIDIKDDAPARPASGGNLNASEN
jgi:uncharacterized protein YgiM (DUF1202 family)